MLPVKRAFRGSLHHHHPEPFSLSVLAVAAALALAIPGCVAAESANTGDQGQGDQDDGSGADGEQSPLASTPTDYSILRHGNRYVASVGDRYLDEVQPALARRCAVCHACTNGPCQLNMTSFAALERGISSTNPYKWGAVDSYPTRVSDNRPLSH